MRVSKQPEERRQEILDTAMKLFGLYGYEAISVTDIAKEMNVVSGLCYRYFKSKEEIYQAALNQYAEKCAEPYLQIIDQEFESFDAYQARLCELFLHTDGNEKYHDFFHCPGNYMFHKQLEICMLDLMKPHMISLFGRMKERGLIKIKDAENTALMLLYGQMPIINNDHMRTEEKIQILCEYYKKMLELK